MLKILSSTPRSLLIQTGDYQVEYGISAQSAGQIVVRRAGAPTYAIATRLANGFDLDPLAPAIVHDLAVRETADGLQVEIHSARPWADFHSNVVLYRDAPGLLHWQVRVSVKRPMIFDRLGWESPDCEFLVEGERRSHPVTRYFVPRGPAAGMLFFHDHALRATALYFEDLTSLNSLYEITGYANPFQASPDFRPNPNAVRMGEAWDEFQWAEKDGLPQPPLPWQEQIEHFSEFGFTRPPGVHFTAGQSLILADSYLFLSPEYHRQPASFCRLFCEMLAQVYRLIARPSLPETDWANEVVPAMVNDILSDPDAWGEENGQRFVRAYVSAAGLPGAGLELITLTDLLLPLIPYTAQHPEKSECLRLKEILEAGLPHFWDKAYGGFTNSLKVGERLSGWYHFWSALNVCDLALNGNPDARRMIQASRDKLFEVGERLDYSFAIFDPSTYKQSHIYNFEVAGVYVYVMMALYRLSEKKDAACLEHARAAAEKMRWRAFDLTYEQNGVMAGAVGLYQLYQETGDAGYLALAYIPLANTLRWAVLWNCQYGVGKHSQSFWAFLPTPGNYNLAEHEAHHTRRFLRQFYQLAQDHLTPALRQVIQDSWRYGQAQSRFTICPYLIEAGGGWAIVAEGSQETTCGKIRHTCYVPLEDVHIGWCTDDQWYKPNPKNGVVGQEIYGAGGPIWYAVWDEEDRGR